MLCFGRTYRRTVNPGMYDAFTRKGFDQRIRANPAELKFPLLGRHFFV